MPHIQDFSSALSGSRIFSTINLIQGYHQFPIHPKDIAKTAISTPFGLFKFLRMPFGLRDAGQVFHRLMAAVVRGLNGVFLYVDNILVASADAAQHMRHLLALFKRLHENCLIVRPKKSIIAL